MKIFWNITDLMLKSPLPPDGCLVLSYLFILSKNIPAGGVLYWDKHQVETIIGVSILKQRICEKLFVKHNFLNKPVSDKKTFLNTETVEKLVSAPNYFYSIYHSILAMGMDIKSHILLMEFLFHHKVNKGPFFANREGISKRTTLSTKTIRTCEQKLVELGFISIEIKIKPGTNRWANFITINIKKCLSAGIPIWAFK